LREGFSTVGGGSLPGSVLPTWLVAVTVSGVETLANVLREAETPVIGRIADDQLLLDPRTVLVEQEEALVAAIIDAMRVKGMNKGSGG
jgi:L-seryl-tRNA(Ser) seleniumtransferase